VRRADIRPRDVWLLLPDQLSARLFFDSGIVGRLHGLLGESLVLLFLLSDEETEEWGTRAKGMRVLPARALLEPSGGGGEIARRIDSFLDRHAGYYPLAIRLNYRHGFHLERMTRGHRNWMLDSARSGRLPRWEWLEKAMARWHFNRRRYVAKPLLDRTKDECAALVLSNVQPRVAVPFLLAARRLDRPVVALVARWDHTVG
jgi:hypothetical protein